MKIHNLFTILILIITLCSSSYAYQITGPGEILDETGTTKLTVLDGQTIDMSDIFTYDTQIRLEEFLVNYYIRNLTHVIVNQTDLRADVILDDGNYTLCRASFICDDWSTCTESSQYRSCQDINECADDKIETQDCDSGNIMSSTGGGQTGGDSEPSISNDDGCFLAITKPTSKVVTITYSEGSTGTGNQEMIFYNKGNLSHTLTFEMDATLKNNCELKDESATIGGMSYYYNEISCNIGSDYKGSLNVKYGENICDTDIVVEVVQAKTWILRMIEGNAGIIFPIVFFFVGLLLIGLPTILVILKKILK